MSVFFCLSFFIAAHAQPVATTEFPFKMTVDQYVEKFSSFAIDEMYRNRIPASITLAQGLLESGNGNSRLALVANNHFGIGVAIEPMALGHQLVFELDIVVDLAVENDHCRTLIVELRLLA